MEPTPRIAIRFASAMQNVMAESGAADRWEDTNPDKQRASAVAVETLIERDGWKLVPPA